MLRMLLGFIVGSIQSIRYCLSDFSYGLWDVLLYYRNVSFALTDLYVKAYFVFDSPYRISSVFRKLLPDEMTQVYGEVPLIVVERAVKTANLQPHHMFWELGAGRGRIAYWVHHFIGSRVHAVDAIPIFVHRAQQIISKRKLKNIEYTNTLIQNLQFSKCDVALLYGSAFSFGFINSLAQTIAKTAKPGFIIISVSFSMQQRLPEGTFERIAAFKGKFTWGSTMVYIERLVQPLVLEV